MRTFTDEEILARVESTAKGFQGWKDGYYDVWVRAKRTSANFNQFCDKVFTYEVKNGVKTFITACTGTSTAGAFGLLHFDEYTNQGCAVLDGDTIMYGSHAFGYHKHIVDHEHEAYVEVKGFNYHRDSNKNLIAEDNLGPEHTDVIGANCHHAGVASTVIANWSVACLVRNVRQQFDTWLNYLKGKGKPALNVCILNEF